MKKNTTSFIQEHFVQIGNDVDLSKVGSNTEEVVAMFETPKYKIPVVVSYNATGVRGYRGVKAMIVKTVIDNTPTYGVMCTASCFANEADAEKMLVKLLTLVFMQNGKAAADAEAAARANIAKELDVMMWIINSRCNSEAKKTLKGVSKKANKVYSHSKKTQKTLSPKTVPAN